MKFHLLGLISLSLLLCHADLPQACAQANDPFRHTLQVTGKEPGSYNIGASVKPLPAKPVPFEQQSAAQRELYLRSLLGETSNDAPAGDPDTTFLVNQAMDLQSAQAEEKRRRSQRTSSPSSGSSSGSSSSSSRTPSRQMSSSSSSGSSSSPYQLLTDGSLGSELVTEQAIDAFFYGLPNDVASALYSLSHHQSPVSVENDPYVPYAQALQNGDFSKMRDLANSPYIGDWHERINMLGTAGAAALRNLSDPNNPNKVAARDALQKIAEDLQYAGQGLDSDKPSDAKLRTICAEIARIWGNVSQPPPAH